MTVEGTPRARLPAVVDDEPDMLDFIERATRRTYDVVRCPNGEAALALLATTRFDLMVTDHKMPRLTGARGCSTASARCIP